MHKRLTSSTPCTSSPADAESRSFVPQETIIRSVHTIASLRADHGGPSRSVTALGSALTRCGVAVDIVALERQAGQEAPIKPPSDAVNIHLRPGSNSIRALVRGNFEYEEVIRALCASREDGFVVHDHGVWLPTNHRVARLTRQLGLPRVLSPRGMLSAWALDYQRWKKRAAWLLYQRRDLRTAMVLHATSQEEAQEMRSLGLRQPIAILPNGVDVPSTPARLVTDARKRYALFLSRVHPKKGLLNLVAAWARVRPQGWRLVIAGPSEGSHRGEVEQLAATLGIQSEIEFVGSVDDRAKWDLYRCASLFVLPTFSENFGIVIAEALATGVPVITTVGAPWSALSEHRSGWWIDIGVDPLVQALADATSMHPDQLFAMGERGREFVRRELSWDRIATQMRQVYAYMIGREAPPPQLAMG